MKIDVIDEDTSSITATRREWAILGALLQWLRHEQQYMDKATTILEEAEILPAISEWDKATIAAMNHSKE